MTHFYQTTPLTENELSQFTTVAESQDHAILRMMKEKVGEHTAWEIKEHFPSFEITSIRRSLFTLEKEGKIQQMGFCRGPKGRAVGKYQVVYLQGILL